MTFYLYSIFYWKLTLNFNFHPKKNIILDLILFEVRILSGRYPCALKKEPTT